MDQLVEMSRRDALAKLMVVLAAGAVAAQPLVSDLERAIGLDVSREVNLGRAASADGRRRVQVNQVH